VHAGRRTAVARADVVDADRRGIAVASGSAIAEGAAYY
jgi:acyl-coenzyme A thioesterase PaaI-like protein